MEAKNSNADSGSDPAREFAALSRADSAAALCVHAERHWSNPEFRNLVERHLAPMIHEAAKVAPPERRADLVQDLWARKLLSDRPGMPPLIRGLLDGTYGRAWLRLCMQRLMIDHRRRAGRRPEITLGDASSTGEPSPVGASGEATVPHPASAADDVEFAERRQIVQRCLAALPEPERDVLRACYFDGKPHEEVARELGLQAGALRMRLLRARNALKALLLHAGLGEAAELSPTP